MSMNQTMSTSSNTVEVARQTVPLNWRAKLARNPEWFTATLIVITCVIVASINPRFFQWATLFDLLHSATTPSLFALGKSKTDLIFNLVEGYAGDDTKDLHIPAFLELVGLKYTGSGPHGLLLAQDKSLDIPFDGDAAHALNAVPMANKE